MTRTLDSHNRMPKKMLLVPVALLAIAFVSYMLIKYDIRELLHIPYKPQTMEYRIGFQDGSGLEDVVPAHPKEVASISEWVATDTNIVYAVIVVDGEIVYAAARGAGNSLLNFTVTFEPETNTTVSADDLD